MTSTALITGATGFLGRHLLQSLDADSSDWNLAALVRDPHTWEGYEWNSHFDDVDLITGDITDAHNALPHHCERRDLDVDIVFHLAGKVEHSRKNPDPLFATNVDGTLSVIRAAHQLDCRLVVISTSGTVACFDEPGQSADEDAPFCRDVVDRWPYYRSKIAMEIQGRALADDLDVELTFIRPPILFGPGDHRFRSTGILLKFLRQALPAMPRGTADFTDVRDVADALVRLAHLDAPRPVYHTPGTAISLPDLFELGAQIADVQPPRTFIPTSLLWGACSTIDAIQHRFPSAPLPSVPDPVYIEMAAAHWHCTTAYADDDLGFEPRPLKETLQDSVDWLRDHAPQLQD